MNKTILIIILSILTFSFSISYIAVKKKLQQVQLVLMQLVLVQALSTNLELNKELLSINTDEQKIHNDNFLKFLSDSRDWAFQYIEEIQNGLIKFIKDVDPYIDYFDNYGDVLSDQRPDYDSMKQISLSYKDLKKLLPTEENK